MNKITAILSLLLITSGVSCTKTPEKVISPSISIKKSGSTISANLTGGILNKNPNDAIMNYSAELYILDNDKNPVLQLPVNFKTILPFETAVIQKKIDVNEAEADRIFLLIHRKKSSKELPDNLPVNGFIDSKKVFLKEIKLKTVNISDLLKEKRYDK